MDKFVRIKNCQKEQGLFQLMEGRLLVRVRDVEHGYCMTQTIFCGMMEYILVRNVAAQRKTKMRKFKTGATRDTDDGKFDWEGFISPISMTFFAKYMHQHRMQADGTLRDGDNWQKGIPRQQYMKSLIRHIWDLWFTWRMYPEMEDRLVDLLSAALFNIQGMLHEIALGRDVKEDD